MRAMHFPYQTDVVSEKQFETHLSLYQKSADAADNIQAALQPQLWPSANSLDSEYRALRKEQAYALNSVTLHEAYFRNITRNGGQPGESTLQLLQAGFGSFESWRADFTACALSARGWCVTAYHQRTHETLNNLMDAHDAGPLVLAFPLIVLDMYEHAYFIDDGADKAAYIARFIDGIDWQIVEARAWAVASAIDE